MLFIKCYLKPLSHLKVTKLMYMYLLEGNQILAETDLLN